MENWYDSMPRVKRAGKYDFRSSTNGGGVRIDSHFKSSHCVVCGLESSTGESPFLGSTLFNHTIFMSSSHITCYSYPPSTLTSQRSVPTAPLNHPGRLTLYSPGHTSLNLD